MQVEVNRKERANAKWRFASLYILSAAIPALLIINGFNMGKVEYKENEQLVEQLKKRDRALAELSHLAALLNQAQQLKPAFAAKPTDQAKYDQLHYQFKGSVDQLKKLYYEDTALYRYNYNLLTFLDYTHNEFDQMDEIFMGKVEEEVSKRINAMAAAPGGVGPNNEQIRMLTKDLKEAEKTIAKLERQLETPGNPGNAARNFEETEQLRSKAEAMNQNIDGINTLLAGIEEEANKIQKKGDRNQEAKRKILEKARSLKDHTDAIKNSNDLLLSMVR
jgi:DNA repair exonuclease SbcCD ATPase subunit